MSQQFDKRIQSPIVWSDRGAQVESPAPLMSLKMSSSSPPTVVTTSNSPSDKFYISNVKSEIADVGDNQPQTGQVIQVTSGKGKLQRVRS